MKKRENNKLKFYSDGGARGNPGPAASAFVVVEDGKVVHKEKKYLGKKTNNEAEYLAVVMALKWLKDNQDDYKGRTVFFKLDSELVTRQISGVYKVKSPNLKPLIAEVKNLQDDIKNDIVFSSLPRAKNSLADALVNKALDERI